MSGGRIVSSIAELQQAEAMTEWIAQSRQLAPAEGSSLLLEPCSSRNGAVNGPTNIVNFKVEMHRRPMSMIVANRRGLARRQSSGGFRQ